MAENKIGTKELAAAAVEAYNKFGTEKKNDHLRQLYDHLYNLDAMLREEMQKNMAEPVKILISKLEKNTPLEPGDMELIRLWLIGDAEAYLAKENDYSGWMTELTRLMTVISQTGGQIPDVKAGMGLRGTLTDALGLIPNMQRLLEAQDRVKRFEASTKAMDSATMLAIKNLLETKIKSPNT